MEEFDSCHYNLELELKALSMKCDSCSITFIQYILGGWDQTEGRTYEEHT